MVKRSVGIAHQPHDYSHQTYVRAPTVSHTRARTERERDRERQRERETRARAHTHTHTQSTL